MMQNIEIDVRDTFKLQVFEDVSAVFPEFNSLGTLQQRYKLQRLEPIAVYETSNVALEDGFNKIVDLLDSSQSASPEPIDTIAYGTGTSTPQTSDTGLDNQVGQFSVGTITDNGTQLATTSTLDETQLNGNTISEIGLKHDATTRFYNRALIGPREKTANNTFTVDANINLSAF